MHFLVGINFENIFIVVLMVISNIYTIGQVFTSLLLSSRRHLQRTVAKHDIVQSEGKTTFTKDSC